MLCAPNSRTRRETLRLWRHLLKEIRGIPSGPVRRKARSNARELFELHRQESRGDRLEELHKDGAAALRVLGWFGSLSLVRRTD